MSAIAGRVLLIPKGNYDSTATYTMLDMVVYNGSSYICKQECTGVVPTNTTYWMLNASGSAVAYINDIGDVVITNPTNEQVLMYNSTTQKWVNGTLTLNGLNDTQFASLSDGQVLKYNATSQKWENADEAGGILPHLIIISETGSTVTVVKGGTTITATETSAEHFECDVTEFGTWTIHSVLNGVDVTVNLVVDAVKVYTVDDSHFHADITVTYPSGATCSLTDGTTTLYANTNPYTFTVHDAGTYTLSVTLNGKTYSDSIVITTTGQTESVTVKASDIYDGSTITPVNDVQTWLYCGDVTDKDYTTISQVLNDADTVKALMTNDNAVDYLVRSTSWVSSIANDSTAMGYIGASDYASDTLLGNSTWNNAIVSGNHLDDILNTTVPTMTSNIYPYGTITTGYTLAGYEPYKAFNSDSTGGIFGTSGTSNYIVYDFEFSVIICKIMIKIVNTGQGKPFTTSVVLQGSNDNSTWTDLKTINASDLELNTNAQYFTVTNKNKYRYYRLFGGWNNSSAGTKLQFYGRGKGGVQDWLEAGGITNKNYKTLSELLVDANSLSLLINSSNAVDYLVTAKAFIQGVCANSTAMNLIGLNDDCADILYNDTTWSGGLAGSENYASVLTTKVPTMTSNTTPSGVARASTEYDATYAAWKAFNGTWASPGWNPSDATGWVEYEFTQAVKIKRVDYQGFDYRPSYRLMMQYSTDGVNYVDVSELPAPSANSQSKMTTLIATAPTKAKYWRVANVNQSNQGFNFQFYGR